MAVLSDMQAFCSRRLFDDGQTAVSQSDITFAINASLQYWKQKRFWFNEATFNFTMTTGNPVIQQPTNMLFEFPRGGLFVTDQQSVYVLQKISPERYDYANYQGVGRPYAYTYRAGQYEVYYFPQQDYPATWNYIKDYADFANPSDTNDFSVNADKLLCYDALQRLHAELRQDEKMSSYYSTAAQREETNLLDRSRKNNATGSLVCQTIF